MTTKPHRLSHSGAVRVLARDLGFCMQESNIDALADLLITRIRRDSSELESAVNHLYRGRSLVSIEGTHRNDMVMAANRFRYMARTLDDLLAGQSSEVIQMQAAE